jgi:hypothetical protein
MDRYRRAVEKGALHALRRAEKGSAELDQKAMEAVEESFFNEFGMSDKFNELMRLKDQRALLQFEYITQNRKYLLNNIRQKVAQIERLEDSMKNGLNIMQAKNALDNRLGQVIKLNEITVLDFFTKLKENE